MSGTSKQMLSSVCLLMFSLVLGFTPAHGDTAKTLVGKATNEGVHYKAVKTLSLKPIFGCKSDWHVTFFEPSPKFDGEGMPIELPGKISFWKDPAKKYENGYETTSWRGKDCVINFQELIEIKIIKLAGAKKGLQLYARYNTVAGYAPLLLEIWDYDSKTDSFNCAFSHEMYRGSDYKVLDSGNLSEFAHYCNSGFSFFRDHFRRPSFSHYRL